MHDVGNDLLGPADSILGGSDSYTHIKSRYQSSGVTDYGSAAHPYDLIFGSTESSASQDQGTTSVSGTDTQSSDSYTYTEHADDTATSNDGNAPITSSTGLGANGGTAHYQVHGISTDHYLNQDQGTIFDSPTTHLQEDSYTLDSNHSTSFNIQGQGNTSGTEHDYVDVLHEDAFYTAQGSSGTSGQNYNFTQGDAQTDNYSGSIFSSGTETFHAGEVDATTDINVEFGAVGGRFGESFYESINNDHSDHDSYFTQRIYQNHEDDSSGDDVSELSTGESISATPYMASFQPYVDTHSHHPVDSTATPAQGVSAGKGSARPSSGVNTAATGGYAASGVAFLGRESSSSGGSLPSVLGSRGAGTLMYPGKQIQTSEQVRMGGTYYLATSNGGSAYSPAASSPGYRRPGPNTVLQPHGSGGGGGDLGPSVGTLSLSLTADFTPSGTTGQAGDIADGATSPSQLPQDQTPVQPSPMPESNEGIPQSVTFNGHVFDSMAARDAYVNSFFEVSKAPQAVLTPASAVAASVDSPSSDLWSQAADKLESWNNETNKYIYTTPQLVSLANDYSVFTRGTGVAQAIGGVAEVALGLEAIATPVGAPLALHGLDQIVAGAQTAWSGDSTSTYISGILSGSARGLGASDWLADLIGNLGDAAIGIGLSAKAGSLLSKVDDVLEVAPNVATTADGLQGVGDPRFASSIIDASPSVAPKGTLADAEAARDALGQQLGKKSATYTGGVNNGQIAAGRSANPLGCAEDDVARQLGADAQFTKAMGWRRNPATGEKDWVEIPVCIRCQGKYSPGQFPPDVQFQPGGPWGSE